MSSGSAREAAGIERPEPATGGEAWGELDEARGEASPQALRLKTSAPLHAMMRLHGVIARATEVVCLTSWRSAANAPDGGQDAFTICGAFVSCNGVLGGRVVDPLKIDV